MSRNFEREIQQLVDDGYTWEEAEVIVSGDIEDARDAEAESGQEGL